MVTSIAEKYADRKPRARCDSCVFFKDQYLHNLGDSGYPNIYGYCAAGIRPSTYNLYFACDEAYTAIPDEDRVRGVDARIELYERRTQKESEMDTQNARIVTSRGDVDEIFAPKGDVAATREIIAKMSLVKAGEAIIIPAKNEDEALTIRSRMTYWAEQAGWRKDGERGTYRTKILNGNGNHQVAVLRVK